MKKYLQYSDQGAKIASEDYTMLRPYDHYGRRRIHYFEFTIPTGAAAADIYGLMKIPSGARIVGGEIVVDADAGSTVDIGVAAFDGSGYIDAANSAVDDSTFLADGLVLALNAVDFPVTLAKNYGYVTEKALWVQLSDVDGLTAGTTVAGSIEIVVD
jgi:hypothetical protein